MTLSRKVKPSFTDNFETRSKLLQLKKEKVQKKDKEKEMTEDVISNDCDIFETFQKFFCKYCSKFETLKLLLSIN